MKRLQTALVLAGGLWLAAAPVSAPAQTPVTPDSAVQQSPIAIDDPFVIPWHHDTKLACIGFTNTSDRVVQAVRFGLSSVQQDPLGSTPSDDYIDRLGSFAPGVAIKPPTRFLGTVSSTSPALQNCWETPASTIKTELHITVLKVIFADGTAWLNPSPSVPLASVTY